MKAKYFLLVSILITLYLISCFPTYEVLKVDFDTIKTGNYADIQAKLFTNNNTILFPKGFEYSEEFIQGDGVLYSYPKNKYERKAQVKISKDSIIAMIAYEETTSGTRYLGSFLFGLTAPVLSFLGVYCLSCPKCCFGSCPTIYTFDGSNYNLEAELFSECISKQLENKDLDLLKQKAINDTLKIKITNEALETHYINKFEIVLAHHSKGTELFPTTNNNLLVFKDYIPSKSIKNKDNKEITSLLLKDDNQYYRSGVEKVAELKNGVVFDFIEIEPPKNAKKILLKYRNTLLSTTLLYDVVIGSQGIKGLEWTKKMNDDPIYAAQFKMVYDMFSGIKIKFKQNDEWKQIGYFKDAGPLNWKYLAAEIDLSDNENNTLRLEFIPDNFMIDYISFDTTKIDYKEIETEAIYPAAVFNSKGKENKEILSFLIENDNKYLVTEPGDSYLLNYYVSKNPDKEQTFLIKSKGYYNEWIRGNWINNNNSTYTFNLYNIQETLNSLSDSWLKNCELLENEFFNSKIILKEER